jgi:hypothetical protein
LKIPPTLLTRADEVIADDSGTKLPSGHVCDPVANGKADIEDAALRALVTTGFREIAAVTRSTASTLL